MGYFGRPDPALLDSSAKKLTPDFISYGVQGDVQILDVKSFDKLDDLPTPEERVGKIEERISELERYHDIDGSSVVDYFSKFHVLVRDRQELIVVVPETIYATYKDVVEEASKRCSAILWKIDVDTRKLIKISGTHIANRLEQLMNGGINLYPTFPDLIFFTRDSRKERVLIQFIEHLVSCLVNEHRIEFSFDEVDGIVTDSKRSRPPIFEHLPVEERKESWRYYLQRCIDLGVIVGSRSRPNSYVLAKPTVLEIPYARNRILDEVRKKLRL
jgi:hypothetical protein